MTQLRDERGRFTRNHRTAVIDYRLRPDVYEGSEEQRAPRGLPMSRPRDQRPRLHAIVQFAAGLWAVGFLLYMLPATLMEQNWLGSAGLVVGFGLILAAIWGDRW